VVGLCQKSDLFIVVIRGAEMQRCRGAEMRGAEAGAGAGAGAGIADDVQICRGADVQKCRWCADLQRCRCAHTHTSA